MSIINFERNFSCKFHISLASTNRSKYNFFIVEKKQKPNEDIVTWK